MTGYEAARSSAALVHRSWRALVRVTGEQRAPFLQGLLSSDVEAVAPGAGCRALLLDVKGHVVADLDLWIDDDAIHVGCDAAAVDTVITTLQKYVLGSPVVLESRQDEDAVLALVGPRADEVLRDVGAEPPGDGDLTHAVAEIDGTTLRLARTPSFAGPGVEIHLSVGAVDDVSRLLKGADPAPVPLGWEESEALRIEAGLPRVGAELTAKEFPQEAGLDDAVSYEKGCYLGQETVARIHYRGQVNRLLRGLRFDEPVDPGARLTESGRGIGEVTSVAGSPRFGSIGLGYVRREAAPGMEAGVQLDSRPSGSATIVELPFGS